MVFPVVNGVPSIVSWPHTTFPSAGIYFLPNGHAGAGKQILGEHTETVVIELFKAAMTNHYTIPTRLTHWPNQ